MTTNLQTHLREVGMKDKRHTMNSSRVGRVASHNMDGTATDVLMEYVGWKSSTVARRGNRVAAAAGVERSCATALMDADALPLSTTVCTFICSVPRGQLMKPRGQGRSLGITRTTRNPRNR